MSDADLALLHDQTDQNLLVRTDGVEREDDDDDKGQGTGGGCDRAVRRKQMEVCV